MWRVTLPGYVPLNITYDNSSNQSSLNYLGMNISSTLREIRYGYIESVIVLTVVNDVNLNGTEFECSIGADFDVATVTVKYIRFEHIDLCFRCTDFLL